MPKCEKCGLTAIVETIVNAQTANVKRRTNEQSIME